MKGLVVISILIFSAVSYARCPSTEVICEDDNSYSIVETEGRAYGSHNWMEMEHKYPDFIKNENCKGCEEQQFSDIEDRTIAYIH
jgi:hypothetical protein